MYYKLEEDAFGDYINEEKVRFFTNECNKAYTPEGINVGYTFFETREDMKEAWGITEYVEDESPVLEGELLEGELST